MTGRDKLSNHDVAKHLIQYNSILQGNIIDRAYLPQSNPDLLKILKKAPARFLEKCLTFIMRLPLKNIQELELEPLLILKLTLCMPISYRSDNAILLKPLFIDKPDLLVNIPVPLQVESLKAAFHFYDANVETTAYDCLIKLIGCLTTISHPKQVLFAAKAMYLLKEGNPGSVDQLRALSAAIKAANNGSPIHVSPLVAHLDDYLRSISKIKWAPSLRTVL